jgi:co-chaperonin GroES (HSP10)
MGARALVKRLERPKSTSSLIVIPDTVEDQPSQYALVLAVGKLVSGGFDMGDTVILKDYSGTPVVVVLDDEEIEAMVVVEDDVLAVVEGL